MTSSVRDQPAVTAASERPAGESGRRLRWLASGCGVIAGLAGLALADFVSRFVSLAGAPLPAVGNWLISLFPAGLIEFGKTTLGTADKPILLVGVAVISLLLAGAAGQLELRRRWAGTVVFVVLAVLAAVGVHSQADATLASYLPTLTGMVFGYLLLESLITRLTRADRAESAERRRFLRTMIIGGAVAGVGFVLGRAVQSLAGAADAARSKLGLPTPQTRVAADVPAGADLDIAGISPYVTPNEDFYRIDTALRVPTIDPADWSLRVYGMVENEITMTFDQLTAEPMTEHLATLACVSNTVGGDLIGNAHWLGWPIRELLARAKPQAGADMVLSRSHDGFTAGTPLEALTDPDRLALLAVGMNGEPLPLEHGFPVRMVVPGLYGYVSATKWVTELKVTTFEADYGYWTPLGWSEKGPIKLEARIDVPNKTVDAGTVAVAGVAWRQHVGVKAVQVRVDGGGWQFATLAETAGPDTWRQWHYDWQATSGDHTLEVRATDAEGNVQTEAQAQPAPDGATGYHQVSVKVR